jgi:TonB family protein
MKSPRFVVALLFALICTSQAQTGETQLGSQTPSHDLYATADRAVTAPQVINAPDPKYSKEGRKKKIEGTVVLWVTVGPDGLPRDIKVRRSLGYGLDEEAIKAVKQWRFKPGKLKGQPVAVQINIDINFRLN